MFFDFFPRPTFAALFLSARLPGATTVSGEAVCSSLVPRCAVCIVRVLLPWRSRSRSVPWMDAR